MNGLAVLTVGLLAGIGLWLLLDRQLLRVALGVAVLGNAINLALLTAGRLAGDSAAFVSATQSAADAANPLPQALVLTAIVIGFGLFAFVLVLVERIQAHLGNADSEAVTAVADAAAEDPQTADPPRPADATERLA